MDVILELENIIEDLSFRRVRENVTIVVIILSFLFSRRVRENVIMTIVIKLSFFFQSGSGNSVATWDMATGNRIETPINRD
jgi:predicted AAA+ superfamily ATPase